MSDRHRDMWTAFLLSLAVPGAGQLWSCLAYFTAVVGLATPRVGPLRWPALAALGVVSAWHARRCVEAGGWRRGARRVAARSRVVDRSGPGSGIDLLIEVDVERPAVEVWASMSDLPRFVTFDPLHSRVIVNGPGLQPGVDLTIEHRVFGLTFFRFGKLLTWRDGCGYSFSDLSPKGAEGFFPHVFDFAVAPDGHGGARLTVTVRGKWTSRRGAYAAPQHFV